tara:strand:- start:821 stop:1519 length:699 start_codon:yes stop_codon:yes gene_type:complete
MKIAVCYHGKLGKHDLRSVNNFIDNRNKASDKFECDIFCHSWTDDKGEFIKSELHPTDGIYEQQIIFPIEMLKVDEPWKKTANEGSKSPDNFLFKQYSSAYSAKRVLELKKDYEKNFNFLYDIVILTRYDLCMKYIEDLKSKYMDETIYVSKIKGMKKTKYKPRIKDYIFISNTKNMDTYATLFDNMWKYRHDRNMYKSDYQFDPHSFKSFHIKETCKLNIGVINCNVFLLR